MINVAIIGMGDISAIHLHAIEEHQDANLVALCDQDERLSNAYPRYSFYTNFNEMLNNEAIDVVHVCLPHHEHEPVTTACMARGVHVLQEKPLARNHHEGQLLMAAADTYPNIKLAICFQNRFNRTFTMLQELLGNAQYGAILGIKGIVAWHRPRSYYETKPWRSTLSQAGGGVMINQAIHTLDLMQLIGGPISSLTGTANRLLGYGYDIEDTANAHIKFKNGATGLFFATNANASNSSIELEVNLERATFTIKDGTLSRVIDHGDREFLTKDELASGSKFYYGTGHRNLIHDFYACIVTNRDDYVHARDAQISLKMIDAIWRSSEEKKTILWEELDR